MSLDFTKEAEARAALQSELTARLREQAFTTDARVQLALEGLTNHEVVMLTVLFNHPAGQSRGWEIGGSVLSVYEMALARLTDKHLIRMTGRFPKGFPVRWTPSFGQNFASP